MGYYITSPSQIIDKAKLLVKLELLRSYVNKFGKAADTVIEAGIKCSPDALAFNGIEPGKKVIELGEEMKQQQKEFIEYIDELEEEAAGIYSQQWASYRSYLAEQERKKAEEEANKSE